jgi:hypothetical protein
LMEILTILTDSAIDTSLLSSTIYPSVKIVNHINLFNHHQRMGRIVNFELCLSETAVGVVNRYKIDIVKIASEAVFEHLRAKIEAERALELKDNEQLREQLRIMEGLLLEVHSAELARAMCKI